MDADRIVDALSKTPDYASPGDRALSDSVIAEAKVKTQEMEKEADAKWRETGFQVPYRSREAYASGADFKTGLPNQFQPPTVSIGGIKLATGEVVYGPDLPLIREGAKGLSQSTSMPGKRPPVKDVIDLAKVAVGYASGGKSFTDFNKDMGMQWDAEYTKYAWQAATSAMNMDQFGRPVGRSNLQQLKEDTLPGQIVSQWMTPAKISVPELRASKDFAKNARIIHRGYLGIEFGGSDQEAANWLIDHYRWFDDAPAVGMAPIVAHVSGAHKKVIQAYHDSYVPWSEAATEWTTGAVAGNLGRIMVDPTAWAWATVGKFTLMNGMKRGFISILQRMLAQGAVGTATGAAHEAGVQQVTGVPQDTGKIGTAAVVGGVANAAFAGIVPEAAAVAGHVLKKGHAALSEAVNKALPLRGTILEPGGSYQTRVVPEGLADLPTKDPATGAYSPLLRAVQALPLEKYRPEQAIATILKGGGISSAEIEWTGFKEAFIGKEFVSKADIVDYVKSNIPIMFEQRQPRVVDLPAMEPDVLLRGQYLYDELIDAKAQYLNTKKNTMEQIEANTRVATVQADLDKWLYENGGRDANRTITGDIRRIQREGWDWLAYPKRRHIPDLPHTTEGEFGRRPESNYRIFSLHDPRMFYEPESHFNPPGEYAGQIGYIRTTDRVVKNVATGEDLPDIPWYNNEVSLVREGDTVRPAQGSEHTHIRLKRISSPDVGPLIRVTLYGTDARVAENLEWAKKHLLPKLDREGEPAVGIRLESAGQSHARLSEDLMFDRVNVKPIGTSLHGEEFQSNQLITLRDLAKDAGGMDKYNQKLYERFLAKVTAHNDPADIEFNEWVAGLPKNYEELTYAQRKYYHDSPYFRDEPDRVRDSYWVKNFDKIALKRGLFQAAVEGKDWFTWTSGRTQRDRNNKPQEPSVHKSSGFEVGGTYLFDSMSNDFKVKDVVKYLRDTGQHQEAQKIADVSERMAKTDQAESVSFDKPIEFLNKPLSFKFYDNEFREKMNQVLQKELGCKECKVERVHIERSSGQGPAWGIRITPEIRKQLLERGWKLASIAPAMMNGDKDAEQELLA